jgi:cellobiose-specific phosphotransferase system component IIC
VAVLLGLALAPISYFLLTKLLYTIPATAIEHLGGIDSMKRSWRLTSGAFWRTLGYYLVAYLAVSILTSLVSAFSQTSMMPIFALIRSSMNSPDPSAVLASFGAMIPAVAISSIIVLALEVIAVPFMQSYVTYMFIDQVRRKEMPPAYGAPTQGYGYGYQPGQQAQPGPYSAQPPQGYQQPGQGYPPAPQYPHHS